MKIEKKGLYFDADKGGGTNPESDELSPRDRQRRNVLEQGGEEALIELELRYVLEDATMDHKRRKNAIKNNQKKQG